MSDNEFQVGAKDLITSFYITILTAKKRLMKHLHRRNKYSLHKREGELFNHLYHLTKYD